MRQIIDASENGFMLLIQIISQIKMIELLLSVNSAARVTYDGKYLDGKGSGHGVSLSRA